jgi:hypothetical protein
MAAIGLGFQVELEDRDILVLYSISILWDKSKVDKTEMESSKA